MQREGTITIPMQFMADIQVECEVCHGKRFKKEVLDVEYRGKNIYDFLDMTVNQAIEFLEINPGTIEKRIIRRLKPLQDVGLGYVKLGQRLLYAFRRRKPKSKTGLFHIARKNRPYPIHF